MTKDQMALALPTRRCFIRSAASALVAIALGAIDRVQPAAAAHGARPMRCRHGVRRGGGPHPDPRPGVDASHMASPEVVRTHPSAGPAFDEARAIPEILDGIRCQCGCADQSGMRSLLSCYEGEDAMALECDLCEGQARLAYRMHRRGPDARADPRGGRRALRRLSVRRLVTAALALLGLGACARSGTAQGRLSEHAVAAQTIAGTTITVEYYRPVARGRDSLFGKVVTWGEHWTPGANWATTIDVDHDVRLNGARLPKGKYALWTVVQPDRWQVELHRRWRKFHVPPPSDSTDEQLRISVRPEAGPPVEVLTFDFPEVHPARTTLRFRWGTVVVPFDIAAIPPPVGLLRSSADVRPYLGAYDAHILREEPERRRRDVRVEIVRAGDTLRVRDTEGPAAERRDFILSPTDEEHEFRRSWRAGDGLYWPEPGGVVTFSVKDGRATGFEVESEDGGTVERGERRK
jgi:hypothetical protein